MTRKSVLYALAVVVLTGSLAVVALADHQETNGRYGPADSSVSAEPEQGMEQSDAGEIREPMETGAVPYRSESSSDRYSSTSSDDPTSDIGNFHPPAIDAGP